MENTTNKFMVKPQILARILQHQQRQKAREALTKTDRKKKTLTNKQIFNRLAQLGFTLRYKDCTFTFESGMGCLRKANGKGVIGATITDFKNEVEKEYGVSLDCIK